MASVAAAAAPPRVRTRANILLVDDRPQNLLTLEAILEPLEQNLLRANSGTEALKQLLLNDVAVILLDVQMPVMDGFETARLIKSRERTRHIPIIFLTAISKDRHQVFRGYSAGAVDYLFKPFDPEVLRSKVAVFIDLYEKNETLKQQAEQLRLQELAELQREQERRYEFLAESIPQQVWTARPDGSLEYVNGRCVAYAGIPREDLLDWGWRTIVHADDLPGAVARWEQAVASGDEYDVEFRLRRHDDVYRWHLARAVAYRDDDGEVEGWFGTNTDIHDQKRSEEAQQFLLDAGAALASSLDYRSTLARVAELAVPEVADWCAIEIVDDDGELRQLAVQHADPAKVALAVELRERYPPTGDVGAARVVRTGDPELVAEVTDEVVKAAAQDELHFDLIRELGLRSYMCVPLTARGRVLGAVTFVSAESGRRYAAADLSLALELARLASAAVDNAQLYRQAEERARAARVLETVGDGVVLVDRDGVVRLWNRAASVITGLRADAAQGRPIADVLPVWDELAARIPVASGPDAGPVRAETVPVEIGGREIWLSASGVGFDEGTVYAFRDLTEERALETMKSDFVATVSHELRTPLAAIHGSALTILRPDLDLGVETRDRLLRVIAEESDRLAKIVNDLLLASHLDSGRLQARIESCDARELATTVVDAAKTHQPETIDLRLVAPKRVPRVAADPAQLHQVLANLLDNAIKYSPDGGPIELKVERRGDRVRFSVSDEGLGIPAAEHRRVFEKFYRLDPNMTRGIGGTGLGLYICRELVSRVGGRIWVESREEKGSAFFVELPVAGTAKPTPDQPAKVHAA